MSDKASNRPKSGKAKSPVDRAGDLARQIWLAGIGAYGQAFDETQEQVTRRVAQVSEETTKLFEDLVSRGNDLEQKIGAIGALGKMGAEAGAEKLRRGADMSLSLEDRLSRMRDMLGLAPASGGLEAKVDRLQADVAELSAKLDALIALQGGAAPAKAAGRKKAPASKKAAAAKKKKAPAGKGARPRKAASKKSAKRT